LEKNKHNSKPIETDKVEDNFDKWGIHIKVKFRDSEKLQVLTGQRQSGGVCIQTTFLSRFYFNLLTRLLFQLI
jgi:structural maintenance of chromosomes protein 5